MEDVGFDVGALRSELSETLDETVTDATILHDGLNLSVGLDTAAEANAYVLRRPNRFRDSDGFLDVRQEYRVLKRLRPTSVPAPEPVLLVEDCSALESPFLLTTYVEGTAIGLGSLPPERFRYPDARERLRRVVVETLADLHTVDVEPFADVCERKSVRVMVDETIDRMETAMDATGHRPPGFRDVASWLRDNAPAESMTAVCHGDYRPGNILFVGDDVPEVSGVIDWETAWLGDPRTELGYLLLRWRDDGDPTMPVAAIATRHPERDVTDELTGDDAPGFAPFTANPGSPTRRELVERYEDETGIEFEHDRFYRALAALDLAAIWEDIYQEQRESESAGQWEPSIEYMLLVADSISCGEYEL